HEAGVNPRRNTRRNNQSSYRLSGRARRAINQRRKRHEGWVEFEGPERGRLWDRYETARRTARATSRDSMRKSWSNFIRVGAEKLADNQMREYWLWAKRITGRSLSKSSAGSIIYDPISAKVVAEPAAVMHAWSQHYQSLVADVTGHS